MLLYKTKNTLNNISLTWLQPFAVVTTACLAALMMLLIACEPQPATVAPTSTAVPTATPRPTATREPLNPDVRYYLPGQAGSEFRIYATALAEGVPPEQADKDVEVWLMVREGHKGSDEMVDFLLTAGISENAILVEDVSPCYIYVIARVPVSLLRPLLEHPYLLILTLGPTTPAESVQSEPTESAVAAAQKPACLPTATPTPADGAAGTAQEPMDLMKLQSLYKVSGAPLVELAAYFKSLAEGASPDDADKDVETWIAIEGGDAGSRAVSEFLLANGVSKGSLRRERAWVYSYVVAQVQVSLLIRLSQHPNVIYVGDRAPTEAEPQAPSGSNSVPALTLTPSDAAKWHRADSWHDAGFKGKGVKIAIIDTNFNSFTTRQSASGPLPPTVEARCFPRVNASSTPIADDDATPTANLEDCDYGRLDTPRI